MSHMPKDSSHCPCFFVKKGGWECCQCGEQNQGVRRSK